MSLNRTDVQNKINQIRVGKEIPVKELLPLFFTWLDTMDLKLDNLSHDFMKKHLLEDLLSYEGVKE